MIIDFHAHWWPSDRFVHSRQGWKRFIHGANEQIYKSVGITMTDEELEEVYFDPDGTQLLCQMDNAGIDRTVLLPLDWGAALGDAERDIIEQNEIYWRLAQRHSDKIVPFFSIDPKRDNTSQHFLKAVQDWQLKGLKLYPPTGFFPDDVCCKPLYEICLDYGLPVIFHGSTSFMSPTPYSHPEGFKRLARKFPELKMVIAHAGGREWKKDALRVCSEHEHIYLDISGLQNNLDPGSFTDWIENMFSTLKSFERVLFGTDNPIFSRKCTAKEMVDKLKALDIPEEEKMNLLGNTARKLLGIG